MALIGARGVANYGGFETFVAEIGPRLVEKGFEVYCSQRQSEGASASSDYGGVKVIEFPLRFPRNSKTARVFEILYDWYFALKCAFNLRCDVVYCLGVVSGFLLPILRLSKALVVVNVDGIEWRRQKFSRLERTFVRSSFMASCIFTDRVIIDNCQLKRYVPARSAEKAVCIPYGARLVNCPDWDPVRLSTAKTGMTTELRSHGYWLVVARLEPDNSIHAIVEGYNGCSTKSPLVVVGSFSSPEYGARIRGMTRTSDRAKEVIFLGSIFDRNILEMLRCHCKAYIHGHSVGGTNPSLLEAMSAGNIIIAHDNVFNREVCREDAFYFGTSGRLSALLDEIDEHGSTYSTMGAKARARAAADYQWDAIAELYARLFQDD